jgi:hypothetical protein
MPLAASATMSSAGQHPAGGAQLLAHAFFVVGD